MAFRRFRKTMVKKQRSFASRSSSSSRPKAGPYRRQTRRGRLLTVQMMTSHQLCLGHHWGGERMRGSTHVSKHRSHGTPGPKSTSSSRATQRSTPARPLTRDLAGKYGDPATSQVILQGSNSAGSQNLSPGDSTLGTLLPTRSPRSESLPPVERPSSCDTVHNARFATKGSVQQSSVDRPVYSVRAPVTPGPGTGTRYPGTGTRCSVPPNTPGKQGTVTTSGRPITPG